MNKFIKKLSLILTLALSFGFLGQVPAKAIMFEELDPECQHTHVGETFNQGFPCEYGDVMDELYHYCEDCGGLLKTEKRIHKSQHGQRVYNVDGVNYCELCGKPANEDVRLRKRVVQLEELPELAKELEELKQQEQNQNEKEAWTNIIENTRSLYYNNSFGKVIEQGDMYVYTNFVKPNQIKLEDINLDNLNKDGICKNGCKHEIINIEQSKNINRHGAYVNATIYCLDCTKYESLNIWVDDLRHPEIVKELAKEYPCLNSFWKQINFLPKEEVKPEVKPQVKPEVKPNEKDESDKLIETEQEEDKVIEIEPVEKDHGKDLRKGLKIALSSLAVVCLLGAGYVIYKKRQ